MSVKREEKPLGAFSLLGHLGRMLSFVTGKRRLLVVLMLLSTVQAGLELSLPMVVRVAVDDHILPAANPDPPALDAPRSARRRGVFRLALVYLGLLALIFGLGYGVTYGLNHLGQTAVLRVREKLWHRMLRLPVRYFDENPVGRLVTRVANDPANLSELFTSVLATALADAVMFAGVLVMLFWLDANTTLWLLVMAPAIFGLTWWFKRASQRIYRLIRVLLAGLNTFVQESISGLVVIRSFAHEGPSLERFSELNEDFFRTQVRLVHVFAVFRPAIDLFATLAVALVIWYAGSQAVRQNLSIGTLVAFLLYLKMLFRPLQNLADKFGILQSSVISSERLLRILQEPEEPTGSEMAETGRPIPIAFEDVKFAYEPDQPVLRGVTFRVAPGEKVALVGPTGSGKSTLISLLLGFYRLQPGSGRILVGGLETDRWDQAELRRRFALVPQDLFLFSGSILENVGLFTAPDPDRLREALCISRLGRILELLPDGLEHALSERGIALSQGERQLVCFARALTHGGALLVLDEATSSVDSATEALVAEALDDLLRDRTALVVAHRLSTVRSADRILVLNAGRIVEQGSHAELMELDGLYARLYNAQLAAGQTAGH